MASLLSDTHPRHAIKDTLEAGSHVMLEAQVFSLLTSGRATNTFIRHKVSSLTEKRASQTRRSAKAIGPLDFRASAKRINYSPATQIELELVKNLLMKGIIYAS
jgi:hypothetical protein